MPKTENAVKTPPKKQSGALKMLFPYILRYKLLLFATFAGLAAAALIMLALPLAVRRMMDYGFTPQGGHFINSYFVMLAELAILLAAASALRYYGTVNLGENVIADLRRKVFAHLTALSASFYDRADSGEILSRLTADTAQIKALVGGGFSSGLRNFIMAVGAVFMMAVTSPRLSGYVLCAIPVIVLPLMGLARRVRSKSRIAQDKQAAANAAAQANIGAIRIVQAYNKEQAAINTFSFLTENALKAAKNSVLIRALLTGLAIFLIFGSVIAVLWLGAHDVLSGKMSAGALGQFVLYAIFAAAAFGQLSEMGGELMAAAGALERLAEILAIKPSVTAPPPEQRLSLPVLPAPAADKNVKDIKEPQNKTAAAGRHIQMRNVRFAYPARLKTPALAGINLTIRAGETVAIVGASGAGKSTIFALLLRFYDPQSGEILLDNVNIRRLSPQELRAQFAYVAQDNSLFSATVRENIAFGDNSVKDADIQAAAKTAHAADFIRALPQGFDTEIGERGITLSGGQKQRLAIARAVLRNAPILLLDEATGALDAESEMLVQNALEKLMRDRTTLVIAHRLATVLKADRILVMQNGQIAETGTHESLTAQNGIYARLAALQFQKK